MIGERAGYDVGIATGNREAGNVIVTCACWAGNGVASSLPAGLPPGRHLHARVLEAFLVFRRSAIFAIAGVATAALTLSACGSDSLSTTSSTTPAASGSASASGGGVDAALAAKLPEKIKRAGVIKIGTHATYQPNQYLDAEGKTVIGRDRAPLDAVAARFRSLDTTAAWETHQETVASGRIVGATPAGNRGVAALRYSSTRERAQ